MSGHFQIQTSRLQLRQWRADDLPAFASLNADAEVMAFFPETLTTAQSDALAMRQQSLITANGFGFWALEHTASAQLLGFVGLNPVTDFPWGDGVEIGWRLARPYWGNGYATEAALAARDFAFTHLALETLLSFAVVDNVASRAVMSRIGMSNSGNNFAHPKIAPESTLSEHVLYTLTRDRYLKLENATPLHIFWHEEE